MQENGREETEQKVFSIIKQLVPFLDFVKNHPVTLPDHKANANILLDIVQNIETVKASKSWCISFAIYSEKLLRDPKEGLNR
ncbi:MAG: hypothetical protein ABUT20_43950, partial [Bacteroidota bacterium]